MPIRLLLHGMWGDEERETLLRSLTGVYSEVLEYRGDDVDQGLRDHPNEHIVFASPIATTWPLPGDHAGIRHVAYLFWDPVLAETFVDLGMLANGWEHGGAPARDHVLLVDRRMAAASVVPLAAVPQSLG